MNETESLKIKLLEWIRGDSGVFTSFNEAALEVYAHQLKHNHCYRKYCERQGRLSVASWCEIPALPTDAFKFPQYPLRCFPEASVKKFFLTSGTTQEVRGRHDFQDLSLYETSISCAWKDLDLPPITNPWFLSQTPADAPHSSLVHMFSTLAAFEPERWMMNSSGEVDVANLIAATAPVQLFSTALALLRFMESQASIPLPPGSWIFETGGYKGLRETLDPQAFREKLGEFFSIPPQRILNEYSMTELSSQFYRWPDQPCHRGPFWTGTRVIDPETGMLAGENQPGYLEIVDLANLDSVMAIRTQDLAISRGERAFTLLGRDPGALPRGCSRSADDLHRQR